MASDRADSPPPCATAAATILRARQSCQIVFLRPAISGAALAQSVRRLLPSVIGLSILTVAIAAMSGMRCARAVTGWFTARADVIVSGTFVSAMFTFLYTDRTSDHLHSPGTLGPKPDDLWCRSSNYCRFCPRPRRAPAHVGRHVPRRRTAEQRTFTPCQVWVDLGSGAASHRADRTVRYRGSPPLPRLSRLGRGAHRRPSLQRRALADLLVLTLRAAVAGGHPCAVDRHVVPRILTLPR